MKIYLSEHIAQSARERLEERFEIVDNFEHPEELDGIIVRRARVTRDIIERAGKLKVICMHGVGLDTIDVEAAKERGIPVTRVPGGSMESVAELAVTFMLALGRKLKYIDQGMRKGVFDHFGMAEMAGNEVYRKKVGLVGWVNLDGGVYYLGTDGALHVGLHAIGDGFYFFDAAGRLYTGFLSDGVNTFYFSPVDGTQARGWTVIDSGIYYFAQDTGIMYTGLQNIDNKTYLFDVSGKMQAGWQEIGGQYFYFGEDGARVQ